MKRHFIILSLSFLTLLPVSAQNITARLDLGRRDPHPDFYEYSQADEGLITFGPTSTVSTRYLGLTKYDRNLKKQWMKKVVQQNGRKSVDFVSSVGESILVFVSEPSPKEDVIKTTYFKYGLDGKELVEDEILSVYPNEREQKVSLQFVKSPNKRRLMAFKNLRNKRDAEVILYYLFDEEGDFVQNGEITLKYPDNRFKVEDVRVSNQGNVYVLGKFTRTNSVRNLEDYRYIIYRYNTESESGEEIDIALGDSFITHLAFRLDRYENMYVAGFYSNRSTELITGTVLQKIENDGTITLNTKEEFNDRFKSNYLSRGAVDRKRELRNFYLKDIILRSDGGVLLMAEKFYLTYQSYRDIYGNFVDREIYHYEDIVLTSVSGTGEIEWHAIIDKRQVSESPASLSFFNAIGQGGAYVFYEYKPRRRNVNIYYNTIAMDGEVSNRNGLINNYRFGNEFYPNFCEQVNNEEAIMVYYQNRGRTLSVVKVNFAGGS